MFSKVQHLVGCHMFYLDMLEDGQQSDQRPFTGQNNIVLSVLQCFASIKP